MTLSMSSLEDIKRLAILLAMPTGSDRKLIFTTLRDWLPDVTTAEDGPALSSVLKEKKIDIIFLDSRLEDLDTDVLLRDCATGGTHPTTVVLVKQAGGTAATPALDPLNIAATLEPADCHLRLTGCHPSCHQKRKTPADTHADKRNRRQQADTCR